MLYCDSAVAADLLACCCCQKVVGAVPSDLKPESCPSAACCGTERERGRKSKRKREEKTG